MAKYTGVFYTGSENPFFVVIKYNYADFLSGRNSSIKVINPFNETISFFVKLHSFISYIDYEGDIKPSNITSTIKTYSFEIVNGYMI